MISSQSANFTTFFCNIKKKAHKNLSLLLKHSAGCSRTTPSTHSTPELLHPPAPLQNRSIHPLLLLPGWHQPPCGTTWPFGASLCQAKKLFSSSHSLGFLFKCHCYYPKISWQGRWDQFCTKPTTAVEHCSTEYKYCKRNHISELGKDNLSEDTAHTRFLWPLGTPCGRD